MKLALVISTEETGFDAVAMRGAWAEAVRSAAALGYDGVELAIRDAAELDAAMLTRLLRETGLTVPAVGTGQAYLTDGLSLSHPDEGLRARAIERVGAHIRFAAALGAAVIIGLIRGRVTGDRQATEARLAASVDPLVRAAEREGVGLLIEPINRYETDLLVTFGETLAFIERVGADRLGVLADTFHMNIEEASIEASLRAAGPRLRHVHTADSNRYAPGWGHLDFAAVLATLRAMSYRGWLSAEILPRPDPFAAAQQTIAHLRFVQDTTSIKEGMA
jgi:sugar phosphate isomerase/epimerase